MPAFSKPADARSPCGGTATIDWVSSNPVAFVRVLGRWKNVILYREIKIDPAPLKMRDTERVFLYESGQYPYTWKVKTPDPR